MISILISMVLWWKWTLTQSWLVRYPKISFVRLQTFSHLPIFWVLVWLYVFYWGFCLHIFPLALLAYIPCLPIQSSYLRTLLLPALYDTVILKSSKHCRLTLTMFLDNPHLCSHIKKLAVRPNYYLAWPKSDQTLDEDWVVKMIISLSKHLKNMHTFDWDGLESPQDQLWDDLRVK